MSDDGEWSGANKSSSSSSSSGGNGKGGDRNDDVTDMDASSTGGGSMVMVGSVGGNHIRTALATSDPRTFIRDFQQNHSLGLASCAPVVGLLSLHGKKRSQVMSGLVVELRTKLLERLATLDTKATFALLTETFPLLAFEELRPIPIAAMEKLDRIPTVFVKELIANADLFRECPINIRQQIWEGSETVFRRDLEPLIDAFVTDRAYHARSHDLLSDDRWVKARNASAALSRMALMCGNSTALYGSMLTIVAAMADDAPPMLKPMYGALRSDIVLRTQSLGFTRAFSFDPAHRFASALANLVPDLDAETDDVLARLHDLWRSAKETARSEALRPLGLILGDPFYANALATSVFHQIGDCLAQGILPKNNKKLLLMSELANLGFAYSSPPRRKGRSGDDDDGGKGGKGSRKGGDDDDDDDDGDDDEEEEKERLKALAKRRRRSLRNHGGDGNESDDADDGAEDAEAENGGAGNRDVKGEGGGGDGNDEGGDGGAGRDKVLSDGDDGDDDDGGNGDGDDDDDDDDEEEEDTLWEWPSVDKLTVQQFYPLMVSLMVEDVLKEEHFIEETFVEKEALEATVYTPLAIKILLCYVLSRFSALDSARVALLKGAVVAEAYVVAHDTAFLESLVDLVLEMDGPSFAAWHELIVGDILVPLAEHTDVALEQALRAIGETELDLSDPYLNPEDAPRGTMAPLFRYVDALRDPTADTVNDPHLSHAYARVFQRYRAPLLDSGLSHIEAWSRLSAAVSAADAADAMEAGAGGDDVAPMVA